MSGTKQSPFAYLFMKESFSMPVKGKCTGRHFPMFSIDGFISIMYDNPVFVKKTKAPFQLKGGQGFK